MATIYKRNGEILLEYNRETIADALLKAFHAGADMTRADLTDADMSGADMSGAKLTRSDLTRSNLTGAKLTRSDLTGANLTGAKLTGANLTGANLTGANLTDAYLTGANLTGADLSGADMTGANLTGANLTRATIEGEAIVIPPIIITGFYWSILITPNYMSIGCQRHTHTEWAGFSEKIIRKMSTEAPIFWRENKDFLLKACTHHAKRADEAAVKLSKAI